MTAERIAMIRARLTEAFAPDALNIIDESAKHVGHASAGGAGHFVVEIVSDKFQDKSPVQRHRMIFETLEDAMHNEIHALSIKASTPAEADS